MPKIVRNETEFCSGPSTLSGLGDTNISNPSSGEILCNNGTKWINIGVEQITPSFIHSSISNDNAFLFFRYGKLLIINGVFRGTNVPRYETLYTLSRIKVINSYIPFIQYGGGVGYLAVTTSGNNTNVLIANSNLTDYGNYNSASGVIIIQ